MPFSQAKYGKDLIWPTPNTAFLEHQEPEAYLQPTASGRIQSGDWGCSRNDGLKFHEGIDLKSIRKSSAGMIMDPVGAIADGTIAYVNRDVSESNYGQYIVISHFDRGIEWCSLYAHLGFIEPKIHAGLDVKAGQKIGIMGNTSSSIQIPKGSSHLHFEIVLRLNSKFNAWYQQQNYKTPNSHASWNGMNLQGINPFDFYDYFIEAPEQPFFSYFLKEPVSFEVLLHFDSYPDFLFRNPLFLRGKTSSKKSGWYKVGFTWFGLPVNWIPINEKHIDNRFDADQIYIQSFKHEKPCRNFVNETSDGFAPTRLLLKQIDLLRAGN